MCKRLTTVKIIRIPPDTQFHRNTWVNWLDSYDQEIEMIEIDYPLAHNIIFAGNDLVTE